MVQITTFRWVPPFAQGYVKDLCLRWILEEMRLPYELNLVGFEELRSPAFRGRQPFGQIPVLDDEGLSLFESGAIALHLAEKSDQLWPKDPSSRARARTWVFAALNSVEPVIDNFIRAEEAPPEEVGREARRTSALEDLRSRLGGLETWMQGREFLDGPFTVGDLMMTTILRHLVDSGILAQYPALDRFRQRCESRPAFTKALADQFKTFAENAPPK